MGKRRTPRATLKGWWKYLPFVLVPFGVVFSEAWLRTEILEGNFRLGEMTEKKREVQEEIRALRVEESELRRLSRIDSAAPDLGLVAPAPGQVIVIELDTDWVEDEPVFEPTHDDVINTIGQISVAD